MKTRLKQCKLIVFDFDGVLTDNKVLVMEDGMEAVFCNRGDGLGFDMFRKSAVKTLILSTETNKVVQARANKLKVPVIFGEKDKREALKKYCEEQNIPLEEVCFVGNDINDMEAMKIVGLKLCPSDSHGKIKAFCDEVLPIAGGQGVARHIAELIC